MELLTKEEVAKILKCEPRTVVEVLPKRDGFPRKRIIGRKAMFLRDEIEKWVREKA